MIRILNNCIYFDIVAKALSHAFYSLGIMHDIVNAYDGDASTDDVYIIFTTHHLHETLPKRYISYNFEQLITDKAWSPEFFKRLKNAQQVWDYSLENIKVLETYKVVNVLHVPFGYSPTMDINSVKAYGRRSCEWLMLGAISQIRADKLQDLVKSYADKPTKYLITNSCWGRDLERAYVDTKVGINLHYYPGNTILEVHRIIPMVANRIFVVSERSADPWYDEQYKSLVTFLPRGSDSLKGAVTLSARLLSEPVMEAELDKRCKLLKDKCCFLTYVKEKLEHMKLS